MVTIKDVARRANVSVTSASYALNDTGTIAETTRNRILKAAKDLNYHPNAFARNLKKGKTHTIGVFISRFGGAFYEDILEGIHDTVLKTDYDLIVCPESRTTQKFLEHRQVDGAIVFDSKIDSELLIRLASKSFPIVVMDRSLDVDYLLPLLIDNQSAAREIFYHFYDQGLRRICFVSGALDSFDNSERMNAFLSEADKHNLIVDIHRGNFTFESGYIAAKTILENNALPEAVFCANDQMAIGFIEAMNEHGLKAPEDIAIVGFDDIPVTRYMQPTLSTVGSSRTLLGASAAEQLINFIESQVPFTPFRIPTQFIPRASSQKNIITHSQEH